MGLGHVPARPVRLLGAGGHVQGRQRRGASGEGALGIPPRTPSRAPAARRRRYGEAAEERAAGWYRANGYEVLARNWRCAGGELDIVAGKGDVIVFCEVKARAGDGFGTPAEAVTAWKQARLRRAAARWLSDNRSALPRRTASVRFDVAAITGGSFEIIEEAF